MSESCKSNEGANQSLAKAGHASDQTVVARDIEASVPGDCMIKIVADKYPTLGDGITKNASWGSGYPVHTSFATIMPPNGPSCTSFINSGTQWGNGTKSWGRGHWMKSASSYHTGGVNISLGDGSGRFINDSIEWLTPGQTQSSARIVTSGQSQFGIWGALGSCNGGESKAL